MIKQMKALKKIMIVAIGVTAMLLLLKAGTSDRSSSDMESARGSSPSPSYTYALQIFHAF
tara:strand:- start:138 stop:317 length:180 start_codon:yes stop_codon:yes gene_type:complete